MSDKKQKKLLLIGNGFDISCGLKTSYYDFLSYMKKSKRLTDKELNLKNSLYVKEDYGMNFEWKDIEERYKELIEAINTMNLNNRDIEKQKYINDLNNNLNIFTEELRDYLVMEKDKFNKRKLKSPFLDNLIKDSEVYCISYNYTDIISQIYNGNEIDTYNIHGTLEKDNIVVGHNINNEDCYELVKGSQKNNKKIKRGNQSKEIFEKKFSELHILGCSIIGTDIDDIINLMKNSNEVYIYDYKHDSDYKVEFLKNNLKNDELLTKIKVLPFPKIFIEEKECLKEDDLDFINNVINHPKHKYIKIDINTYLNNRDIKNLRIDFQEIIKEEKQEIFLKILKCLEEDKNKQKMKIEINYMSERDYENLDDEEEKTYFDLVDNIIKFSFDIDKLTLNKIVLKEEYFKKIFTNKIKKIEMYKIKILSSKISEIKEIEVNALLESLVIDGFSYDVYDKKIILNLKNSGLKKISLDNVENIDMKLENLTKLTYLKIINTLENDEYKSSIQMLGNFSDLKNITINTNVFKMKELKLNSKVIEKINITAENENIVNVVNCCNDEGDLFFEELDELNLDIRGIDEVEKISIKNFASRKVLNTNINYEDEQKQSIKKIGHLFINETSKKENTPKSEKTSKEKDDLDDKNEEHLEEEKKENYFTKNVYLNDSKHMDEMKEILKEKILENEQLKILKEKEFLKLVEKQWNGEIKQSQYNVYKDIMPEGLNFKEKRKFKEDVFNIVREIYETYNFKK